MSATLLVAQRVRHHFPAFSVIVIWLGALFVVTWLAAEWFWRANAPDPVILPAQSISDPLLAAQSIASRHLMGDPQLGTPGSATQTSNQFQLTGAMTASKQHRGFAILAEDGKTPLPVMEGEELAPGVVLFKVFANKVELRRQGRTEFLEINDKTILHGGAAISPESAATMPEIVPAPAASGSRLQQTNLPSSTP